MGKVIEPRLRLGRDSIAWPPPSSAKITLVTLASTLRPAPITHQSTLVPSLAHTPSTAEVVRAGVELILLVMIFDRTRSPGPLRPVPDGIWIVRIMPILRRSYISSFPSYASPTLFSSPAGGAEGQDRRRPTLRGMDALLEAGEEDGHPRRIRPVTSSRSAVEVGDKVASKYDPRHEIFAVPVTLPSRVTAVIQRARLLPAYRYSARSTSHRHRIRHDLLKVLDTEAKTAPSRDQASAALSPRPKKWPSFCSARCSGKNSTCASS